MRAERIREKRRPEQMPPSEAPKVEETRCPYCGVLFEEKMVVGKTRTVKKGTRTYYQVVLCSSCGKVYRGIAV